MSLGKVELVIEENLVITDQLQSKLNLLLDGIFNEFFGGEELPTATSTTESTTTICEDNC